MKNWNRKNRALTEELAHFYGEEGEHILQVKKRTYEDAKAYDHKGTDNYIEELFQNMKNELNQSYKSHHCHKFVERELPV